MRRIAFLATVALVSGSFTSAAHACTQRDREAVAVRSLQTDLMVAALACGHRAQYNAFVTKRHSLLGSNAKDLKGLFGRTAKSGGEKALNAFVTQLANDASQRSQNRAAYCADLEKTFVEVDTMDEKALKTYTAARTLPKFGPLDSCDAKTPPKVPASITASAKPAKRITNPPAGKAAASGRKSAESSKGKTTPKAN